MCGRFTLTTEISELQKAFPWAEFPSQMKPRYNIAPSQPVAVIANQDPYHVDFFIWGLIPSWAKEPQIGNRLINARAETLTQKPAFRSSYRYRRCLILADGFFEWRREGKTKAPFLIRFKSRAPFALAGLWDRWQSPDGSEILSCTIITTEANELVQAIHSRMPVILPPTEYQFWLAAPDAEVPRLNGLLRPYPAEEMEAFAVSTVVNNPNQDRIECIQPVS
ncbi:MAG: SOS response-associated peptidase [Anaerolineales bacterium]|nr:SOS response-associated peptidase [Anaerolineales bacterium]